MIRHLNISFDKDKVIKEIDTLHLKPGHSNNWWRAKTEESKQFWYKTDTWLKTIIEDTNSLPEIKRLNAAFKCDIIYVLERGELKSKGKFEELIKTNSIFKSLENK